MRTSIASLAAVCAAALTAPWLQAATAPYLTDFESGAGSEWSNSEVDATHPTPFTKFSGRFGLATQTLTLTGLTAGTPYTIGFDLYIIDTWDGNGNNDSIAIEVNGENRFQYTFSNYNGNPPSQPQTYPNDPDVGRENLGFWAGYFDAIYRNIEVSFTPNTSTAQISFKGLNLQDLNDESWGIDNVSVKRTADLGQTAVRSTSLPAEGGNLALAVEGFDLAYARALSATASETSKYSLREAGPNGISGDEDDIVIPITPTVKGKTITLKAATFPLQPGKYRVTATGLTDSNGAAAANFTRNFNVTHPVLGRIENTTNDALELATSLPLVETPGGSKYYTAFASGYVNQVGDVDYWRFDAEAGDVLTMRLEMDAINSYPAVYLQNASGGNVYTSGGSYYGVNGWQNVTIATPGTYYLRVWSDNNRGPYGMRVEVSRGIQLEQEENDNLAQANQFLLSTVGTTYQGKIAGSLDLEDPLGDYGRLGTLNPGNAVNVNLAFPSGSTLSAANTRIELWIESAAEPVATSESGNLNFTANENGFYFVRVIGMQPGIRAQYLASATITDGVAPAVVNVTLPDEGSISTGIIDRFEINFTEELLASSITNAANYELRGPGGALYNIETQAYSKGLVASYLITDGPLQPGAYQFTVKTTLTDRAGNGLAAPFVRLFSVATVSPFIQEPRSNNTLATAPILEMPEFPAGSGIKSSFARGNLSGASDVDHWAFSGKAGDLVTIASENPGDPAASGFFYYLLNAQGGVIASNNSSYTGRGQVNPFVLPASGTYYVRVNRWYDYTGEYRFRVTAFPSSYNGEFEDNNSPNQAQDLLFVSSGNTITGKVLGFANSEDTAGDFYRLGNLAPGSAVTATLTALPGSSISGVMAIVLPNGTEAAASQPGEPALTFPVTEAGSYFLRVTDAAGGGIANQYILQISIVDTAAPSIVLTTLPDENAGLVFLHPLFRLSFSEDMFPAAINSAASYELRSAGADGNYGNADDVLYAVAPSIYERGLNADYTITNGPLHPGKYRFTAKTVLKDRNGNSLAAPFVRNFTINAVPGFILESRDNNTAGTATTLSQNISTTPDGSFSIGENIVVPANNPWGIVAVHLNTDNRFDLVTANYGGAGVSVFIAGATGGFTHKANHATAPGSIDVAAGDLNGDGKPDLVVANHNADSISVLIGTGDGEFLPAVQYPAANSPRALALADFNGDGRMDVAAAHYSHTTVGIFLGKGDGTLLPRTDVTVGTSPHGIVAADLNKDGMIDLAVPNYGSATVSVLIGNGNGTFKAASNLPSGPNPRSITTGDFNADGRPDLATINYANSTVSVFLGKPDGTFQDFVSYPAASSDPYHIVAADADKDNIQDLLVASYGNSEVKILLGIGNGTFQAPSGYRIPGNPIHLAVADFNNDGNIEIATANYGSPSIGFLYPNPTQNLAEDPTGSGIRTAYGRGNLTDATDLDYFSFTGQAGDRVVLATETPGHTASSGLLFEIFSTDGTQLTYVYPNPAGWGETPPVVLPYDGTYTVRVRQWHAYYGEYRFRLTLARPPVQLESEANNNFTEADAIEFSLGGGGQSATVLGYLNYGDNGPGDYYSLGNLSGGTTIRWNLAKPTASLVAARVEVFNAQRQLVFSSAPGAGQVEYLIPEGQDGFYYLLVTSIGPSRTGDAGPFLEFNGSNQYVNTGNWSPGPRWTTEAWIRPSAIVGGRRGIVGGYGECRDWGITMENGQLGMVIRQPGGCSLTVGSGIFAEVERWYHLVATSDGQTARIYVNGELRNSAPVEPDYEPTSQGTWIGGEACCGNYFPGLMDEVRIWNRDLPLQEIAANMNSQLAGNESGLAGYWRFDEGTGTTVADRSSGNHTGTIVNGAGWAPAGVATAQPPGLASQYILGITLGDTAPPAITSVSLPAEGSANTFVLGTFEAGFSEDMSPATVTDTGNYELRNAGADNLFGTADDQLYALAVDPYTTGLKGAYRILDGPLQAGNYRFTIKTGVQDRSGSPLPQDYVRRFSVQAVPGFVFESRDNDTFAKATSIATIFNNNPDGSFALGAASEKGGNNPWAIVSGKFDADAHLDVITVNSGSASVSFFAGNGNGTFAAPQSFAVGNSPRIGAAADFNADGKLDIAVANRGGDTISVLLGNGNGTFQTAVNYVSGNGPYGIAVGDFNKDGRPDLAVSNELNDNVSVLLNAGSGVFNAAVRYATGDAPFRLNAVDVNADTRLDLVVANVNSDNVSVLLGNADGTFATASNYAAGNGPRSVAAADFNGDGKIDLAALNASANTVGILIGNGNGTFKEPVGYAANTSDPYQIEAADLNGDGKNDLIIASYGRSEVSTLQGAGDGTFFSPVTFNVPGNPIGITVADFNGDGRLDVATANYSAGTVGFLSARNTELLAENPAGSGIRTGTGRGHLSHAQDVDVWSFSGQAGDRLELAVESLNDPNSSGLLYELYGSDGARILYLYPDSRGFGETPYSNEPMTILPYSGRYYIQVKQWHAYFAEYRFRVSLARPPAHFEREPNDTLATATPIEFQQSGVKQLGKTVGYFTRNDAVDTYLFGNLAPQTSIRSTWAKPTGSSANISMEVVSADGTSLGKSAEGAAELNVAVPANRGGLVYLLVKSPANTQGLLSQYMINTELSDSSAPSILRDTLPAEGSNLFGVVDRFSLNFSEDMLASSINNPANFMLVSAGVDGNFGSADDVSYNVQTFDPYLNGLSTEMRITDGPLQAGKYRLQVGTGVKDRFGNAIPSIYERQFTLTAPAGAVFESRDNGTIATATPLSLVQDPQFYWSGLGIGNLTSTLDLDYWSFDAVAGQKLVIAIETKGSPNSSQLYIRMNKADGAMVDDFYSDGRGYGESGAVTIPADGKYNMLVRYNNDYQGEYAIRVNLASAPLAMENESNGTIATATVATLVQNGQSKAGSIAGYIQQPGDIDYINLGPLTTGSTVFLATRRPASSQLDASVGLYTASNAYIPEAGSGRAGDSVAEVRITADGTYYAAVRGTENSAGIDERYILDIQVVPTGSVAFPNLQVTSIVPPGGALQGGGNALFNFVVKNVGTVSTASAIWTDRVVISSNQTLGDADDFQLGIYPHDGVLAGGASYTVVQTAKLPEGISGDFYLIVQTDSGSAIHEFVFEGDNITVSAAPFAVTRAPYPDLVVEQLAASAPTAQNNVTVTWRTANRGNAPANTAFKERVFVKNLTSNAVITNTERDVTAAIAAGATVPQTLNLTALPAGNYQVVITTDSTDRIYEFNATSHASAELNAADIRFSILGNFAVTAQANPTAGGTVSGGGTFQEGASVTVRAVANTSQTPFAFLNWTENGVFQSADANYTFTVSKERVLVANFILPKFTVTANASPAGAGTITGAGTFDYGASTTLRAEDAFGYRFANWTKNGIVLGAEPSLIINVLSNQTIIANYTEAHLKHDVTTATSPAGLATVTGAGSYNNGQSATFTAPATVTKDLTFYTFKQFTMNGIVSGNNRAFTKIFATTDPTNIVYAAEYASRSLYPLATNIFANFNNPVPATPNLILTIQFNRSMDPTVEPVFNITNKNGTVTRPVVPTGGAWSTTVVANDTYRSKPIAFSAGMDGVNVVVISAARDTEGAVVQTLPIYELVVDATLPRVTTVLAAPSSGSAIITWTTDEPATSQVEYGATTAYGRNTPLSVTPATSHRVLVTGLTPDILYNFRVRSRDAAGNETFSSNATFRTLRAPDLTISAINVLPAQLTSGSEMTVSWTIQNSGVGPTSGSWFDQLIVSNKTTAAVLLEEFVHFDATRMGEIASGGNKTAQYTLSLPHGPGGAGELVFIVTADFYNNIIEDNAGRTAEANNRATATRTSTIRPYPDLQAQNVVINPSAPKSGTEVTVNWNTANTGTAAAGGVISDRIMIRNTTTGEWLVNQTLPYDTGASGNSPIAGGASRQRTFKFELPDGNRGVGEILVEVETDIAKNVFEHNAGNTGENNNAATARVTSTLSAYPDLTVTAITAPANAQAGQTIQVNWTVQNRGTGEAAAPWVEQVFLATDANGNGAQLVGNFNSSAALASQANLNRSLSVTLPQFGTGNRWFVVRVDAGAALFESDEANNTTVDDRAVGLPSTLILGLSRDSVPENSGPGAMTGYITRNSGTENALTVNLSSGAPGKATVPQSITIGAGKSSADFPIAIVNNDLVDGNQSVTITASAAGFENTSISFDVTDDDAPVITVTVDPASIREDGGANAAQGRVTRNTSTAAALDVSLASGEPSRITVPGKVTILAGQRSATFAVAAVDNPAPNRPTQISVNASVTGFQSIPALVDLADDDLPALTLTLTETSISEGAKNPAVYATVTRNPVKNRALTVLLHSSDEFAAKAPVSVTIPANEASYTFPITIVNNDLVDQVREVQIMAFTADSIYETPINQGAGVGVLYVTDDDGPTFKINLSGQLLSERGTLTATVERNTATTSQIVVNLASEDETEATVPRTVIIPAGQRTGQFTISGVVDAQADGIQQAVIVASLAGFTSGRASLNVTDVDLPDLRVATVNLPGQGITGGSLNISWVVKNDGIAKAVGPWVDRVYLATSPDGSGLQSLGQFFRTGELAVGATYERSTVIALPFNPGAFYLMVITDAAAAIEEGSDLNNTAVSSSALTVAPAYRATVQTAVTTTPTGVPIKLTGRAFKTGNGDPSAFSLVSIRLNVKGTRRLIEARTDAAGNFETTFVPLPNEAGRVVIGADHPGVQEDAAQDQFDIYGVRFTEHDLALRLFPMSTLTGTLNLQNLGDLPLTALSIVPEGLPQGVSMTFDLGNRLNGDQLVEVPYTIAVGNITTELRIQARLKVTTAEGALAYLPLVLTIAPHRATLVANPGVLTQGMVVDKQTVVEFTLSNVGGAASGPLEVRAPSVPWLQLISPTTLPSLAPGEITKIALRLSPTQDMLATPKYDGSLVIVSATGVGINVPFSFRAISEAVGDLKVEVTDDYTFNVAGAPKVEGATVTLADPFTGIIIANGLTGPNGSITFNNVFEGSYQMTVSAPKHSQYRSPVTIVPGKLTEVTTFIDRQTVTYRWTVVPTEVQDRYKVVLESVFETEVPIPVVTIDNPMMMPLIVEGRDTQMEIRITNHGLIAAERVSVLTPEHPDFEIIPLIDQIDVLPAKTSMAIPIIMRAKPTAQFVSLDMLQNRLAVKDKMLNLMTRQGGTTFTGCAVYPKLQVKWSYVCGPDRRWHLNDASITPVCVEESCWDKIKDLLKEKATGNPKDLLEWKDQLCELAGVLASCVDECLATIVKTACGVATGDVAGAIGGALGFGQCWCPSIPSIPVGPVTAPPLGGLGSSIGGGGGFIGSFDYPVGTGFSWDYSPNCNPGDSVSGGNSVGLGRQTVRDGGVCARVRIRIEQEAVVTRAAFLGTLELENGRTDLPLTDIQMTIDIKDEFGEAAGPRFAIRGPLLTGLTAIDGTGRIAAGALGTAKFTFIPNRLAAPEGPQVYKIGGTLKYKEGDNLVEVPLIPDTITVFPDPILNLVYFQQRDVYSDDPFTDEIEPAEPFGLGLLVKNTGKGAAINFTITSAQPEIIENEKGLLINFKIIGTQVGNLEITPSLTANLGRIDPGQSKTAMWKLLSTLQGKFVEYTATFEHVDALGDARLSLIDGVQIKELIHSVRADRANDDAMADFLTNDDPDPDNAPDTLWMSDGTVAPVNLARNGAADGSVSVGDLQVRVTGTFTSGWNYLKMADPGAGFRLHRIVRSDGKELRVGDNAWQTDRSFPSSQAGARRENLLHLFDYDSTGIYTAHYRVNDSVAPSVVEIIAVVPVVQTDARASVDVILSEPIDLTTFTHEDVRVTLNGGANLATSAITIAQVTGNTYRISGLTGLTAGSGNYEVTVIGEGIQDYGGNAATGSASVGWTKVDGVKPAIVSLQQIVPSLRNAPVPGIQVVFSKPINPATFDFNDLSLVRNGNEPLTGSTILPVQQNATTFLIGGLGNLTTESGDYVLTVNASGIEDTSGNAGNGILSTRWTQDTAPVRLIAIESINTNPRNIVVPSLEVTLSEPIQENSFDFADISLTRNGGANLINNTVRVIKVRPTVYRIENFSFVSGNEGDYLFTVNGAGLRDLAGNAGQGSVSVNWKMDTARPVAPSLFAIVSDLGASATDGITSTNRFTFSGTLVETNVSVRLVNLTTGEDLGAIATGDTKAFSKILELPQGAHRIQVKATDSAGNVSEAGIFEIFVDLSGVTATIAEVSPDPRDAAVTALDVTFSESIWESTFTRDDLKLTRDGSANLINNAVAIQFVSGRTYRIAGLEAITSAGGLYQLSLNTTNVQDVAGNAGNEVVIESWRRTGPNTAPVLQAIGPRIVASESMLTFTNEANDVDIPVNKLTFSLLPGAPAGASINETTGVFTWRPTRAQAPGTYQITVKVADDGTPSLSDTKVFAVTVTDYAELNIGQGIVLTGQRGAVPVEFFASTTVSNVSFTLNLEANRLANLTVEALIPEVGSATITKLTETTYRVDVKARVGSALQARQSFIEIGFSALVGQSAFVKLVATELVVRKPDNTTIPSLFTRQGRAVVLGAEPLVDALAQADRKVVLYGKPGLTYQVQSTATMNAGRVWTDTFRTTLPGFFETMDVPDAPGAAIYYRAFRVP